MRPVAGMVVAVVCLAGSGQARAQGIGSASIGHGLTCWTANGAGPDIDADGLNDSCEANLAYWFGPLYWFDSGESAVGATMAWRPYYSVRTLDYPTKTIRIFYQHTYHRDYGDALDISNHDGDPEFVTLDVQWNGADGKWYLNQMYTSAHRNQWCDESRWHGYSGIEYASAYRAWPVVHVAEDKHANYRTDGECDNGCGWLDNCSNTYSRYLTDITTARTITCGHSECTSGAALASGCSSCAQAVCAVDPYCCNNSWDGICVNEVQQYCAGSTCRNSGSSAVKLVNFIRIDVGRGLNEEYLWNQGKFCGWQRTSGSSRDTCSNGYYEHVTDFGM